MDNAEHPNPNPENPEKLLALKRSKPKEAAAGMEAVFTSMKLVLAELPLGRGIRALRSLNQKDGYDCPGCAWPDPDGEQIGRAHV